MALFCRATNFRNVRNALKLCEGNLLTFYSKRGIKLYLPSVLRELKRRQDILGPQPPSRRSTYLEWNLNAELFAFGKRLNEDFKIELLLQAFISKSYVEEQKRQQAEVGIDNVELHIKDNEKLAEEGEAIISAYVKKYLSCALPKFPLEGILAIHDYLLSEETLAHISEALGATEIILSTEYPVEKPTFAKNFKAIVGALSESQGIERANLFVRDFVVTKLINIDVNDLFVIEQPLKVLEDILKREKKEPPEPRLIGQCSTNTVLAAYTVGIYSNRLLIGQGPGESISTAIDIAAQDALRRLFKTTDSSQPINFELTNLHDTVSNLPLRQWTSLQQSSQLQPR